MATNEGFLLNGLDLNTAVAGGYALTALSMPPPPKRMEWAQGADADGSLLVRDPLHENRTITATVEVLGSSMDNALGTLVAAIVDQLEEAERNPDGIALVWTPAGGTRSVTFYVLSGEITDIPIAVDNGYMQSRPSVSFTLTCKPFGYGVEVSLATATGVTTPAAVLTVPSVPGDVPAEGRLIVTEASSQSRRYVEFGLEQRYYDPATALLIDSEDLVVTGFAGSRVALTGGYRRSGATTDAVQVGQLPTPQAVCGTGDLAHVGTFRVKARVYVTGGFVRLSWQAGDGLFRANDWVAPVTTATFCEVDLGLITIPPKKLGTQKWSGRIDAYSPGGDACNIDYLVLIPTEVYGRARATYSYSPGVTTAHDEFTGGSGNVNGRVAPAGGSWATSGSIGAWLLGSNVLTRTTGSDASPGFAALGTARSGVEVAAAVTGGGGPTYSATSGVLAQYVDVNNYVSLRMGGTVGPFGVQLVQVVAGVSTILASAAGGGGTATMRLVVYSSGQIYGTVTPTDGRSPVLLGARASSVATGGALASGKPGLYDYDGTSQTYTRVYDNVTVATPAPEQIVLYSDRQMEFRHDDTIRQDSTGTYYGPVPSYRGGRFLIPPAGPANRTSRVLVKADRNDIETSDDTPLADAISVEVRGTPRFLVIPR